jgi:hypothetical protein
MGERGMSGACVTDPFAPGQRVPEAARYVHRTLEGRKRRVVSTLKISGKICALQKAAVNRGSKINF